MVRLIYADELKKKLRFRNGDFDTQVVTEEDINAMPTVDLVRCEHCEYHTDDNYCKFLMIYLAEIDMDEHSFCSNGYNKINKGE